MGIMGCCQNMVPSIDETGLNELKWLSLRDLIGLKCIIDVMQQKYVPSAAFSNLVDLSLSKIDLREICSGGIPPKGFLENLETLHIECCDNMSCLFPMMLIQRLQKLKKVTVVGCREIEDLFQLEGLCYAKENPFLLSTLESLHLDCVQNLRYIWKGPTQQVRLQSLTVVEVETCYELRYLFTLSLAQSLLQLEQLKVKRCGSLEQIVEIKEAEENVGGGGGNYVMFPKLRKLQFYRLENFRNFYSENSSLNMQTAKEQLRGLNPWRHGLQNLEELKVVFQNLEELKIGWCRVQVLFQLEGVEQELSLPSLKIIELEYLKELECLCKGPSHLLNLQNLKKLSVKDCNRLRHMFSPSLARNLLQLEELIIRNCGELEEILNEDDAKTYNQTLSKDHLQWPLLFPNLSSINIGSCYKLKTMFPVSMAHLLSLSNLRSLRVDNCDRLRHMFSPSLARNLLQLEELIIRNCGELEYIVSIKAEENVGGGGGNDVMLPKLRIIELFELKNFINFYSENSFINMQTTKKQQDATSTANFVGLKNLETLDIRGCHSMSSLFPSCMLIQSLRKLKKVAVDWCGELEDVFQLEGLCYAKENPFLLSTLEILKLNDLENLRSIWKGPTQQVSLQSLTLVELKRCNNLRYLFTLSLARSLLKLEQLKVWECESLEYIVDIKEAEENVGGGGGNDVMFPKLRILDLYRVENLINFYSENLPLNMLTAKEQLQDFNLLRPGLKNLEELRITGRRSVQVLFQLESLKQELSLSSLKVLVLNDLQELGCLCKGPTHLLSMPNLKKLEVRGCDRLRHMFSPSLARNLLQLEGLIIADCGELEQILDEDDAKTNNQTLSKDHHQWPLLFPNLSSIYIGSCYKLKTMFPVSMTRLLSLSNLKSLRVNKCDRLRHMFSPSLARNFMQVEVLVIQDCGELEEIFNEDDAAEYNQTLSKDHLIRWPLLFPKLSLISISGCDKLTSMFPVSIAHLLSLQNLFSLTLSECHGLTHLFSSALARNLLRLGSIDIDKCEELEQIIVEDHTEGDHVQLGLFPNLYSISLKRCGKFKTLFPDVFIARSGLPKLKTLEVEESYQLEEVDNDEEDMTGHREMVLPQLQRLTLQQLASLVNFCPVGYHFIFPSLSYLWITKCPKLTTRFSVDQNRSVHGEAEALETVKEDVDMENSPPETTGTIYCYNFDDLRKRLPPYIRN
ncbi:hypothetical protein Ddye_026849 [Dipteronia dyeriana]|uniref:Disease resistance protein At4g27190-like leucine-rich repeats domain-containing protein n=1 Tax=Dipteronia dyeriana TaxID=168575 RepID=A0AAD9TMY0_9ROSI|nr:hypothetical protein Ddye_026849 [Dipteronia dyeriana]